jgi:hypothetical protein
MKSEKVPTRLRYNLSMGPPQEICVHATGVCVRLCETVVIAILVFEPSQVSEMRPGQIRETKGLTTRSSWSLFLLTVTSVYMLQSEPEISHLAKRLAVSRNGR